MSPTIACCQEIAETGAGPCPFIGVVELDYYDGPVSGAARCAVCGVSYGFYMLDWDGHQDVRIFALWRLSQDVYERFADAVSRHPKGVLPPEWDRDAGYAELTGILGPIGPVELVFAGRRSTSSMVAARRVSVEETPKCDWRPWFETSGDVDWFGWLGIPRDHPL